MNRVEKLFNLYTIYNMEIRKCVALFVAMIVTLLCYSQKQVQSRDVRRISGKAYLYSNGDQFEIREGVVIAKLKEGKKQVREGIKVIKSHSYGMLEIVVPDSIAIEKYVNVLEKTGDFEYVEFDTYIKSCMFTNDPYYLSGDQWGINQIFAHAAWEITTGSPSVKVAVIDSAGVELHHPDIDYGNDSYSNICVSDYINCNDPFFGLVTTTDSIPTGSHGTMVAGIIAAKTNNGVGIAGIAGGNNCEGAKIIPCRAETSFQVAMAIDYAVEKGAKVINLSLSASQSSLFDTAITDAYNNGVTLVCATGNKGVSQIVYPASHNLTIAVGSTDNNNWVSYSNYGTGLDLVAPGIGLYSTANATDGYYEDTQGTSAAAPHVSGVVALMLSVNPGLTPNNIKNILNKTAQKIKPNTYTYDSSGWNEYVGHGLVNACAAVVAAKHYSISGPTFICAGSTDTYSISGLPPIFGVLWSIDNNDFIINSPNNQCYVSYGGSQEYDVANLTADIYYYFNKVGSVTKKIVSGTPAFDIIITGGDGSHAHWTSNLMGNTVDIEEIFDQPLNYSQYEANLYRLSPITFEPESTPIRHWNSFNTHETLDYIPQGWYLLEVRGINNCGISDWEGAEIECIDTEWPRSNGSETELTLMYNRAGQLLTVSVNHASRSTTDNTYTLQLWSETIMVREYNLNDPVVKIPMAGLKNGLYTVRYVNRDEVIAKKFMKL